MSVRQAVTRSLGLLSPRDRRLLLLALGIQMTTSLLDIAGVLLIGIVGALAVTIVQSQPPPEQITAFADFFGLGGLSPSQLAITLAAAAAVFLLLKSGVSSYLVRRSLTFLANRQAILSGRLTEELLSRPLTFLHERSSQDVSYALMGSAGAATVGVLGHFIILMSEATLLILLGAVLLLFDPLVTLGAIGFFAALAYFLHRAIGGWAHRASAEGTETQILSLNAIQEALAAYREIVVTNRRGYYIERIQKLRWRSASLDAQSAFIAQIPKFYFDAALVIGGFALCVTLLATKDAVAAVGTLALFLAAASRVMPSLLRLQGSLLGLRGTSGAAQPTYRLAEELSKPADVSAPAADISSPAERRDPQRALQVGSDPQGRPTRVSVSLRDVSFRYPKSERDAVHSISIDLDAGHTLAIVGPSGGGKTTLADVILGVLRPSSGSVLLNGLPPTIVTSRWPGLVSYAPQDAFIAQGTIRSNVALGLPPEDIDDDLVWKALTRAHLAAHVASLPDRLSSDVGERGARLSGGQRQRLGLARALYSQPRLLVLDEATSALDAETEADVAETLRSLSGEITMIVVAHRLSTVRSADLVVFIEEGALVGLGDFGEVRRTVPAFERQAHLLGLSDA